MRAVLEAGGGCVLDVLRLKRSAPGPPGCA